VQGLTRQRSFVSRISPDERCQRPSFLTDELKAAPCRSTSGALVNTMPRSSCSVAMKGAHQLALGGERHFADARQACVERFGAETCLSRGHQQRTFCRITLHRPSAIAFLHAGVVCPVRNGQRALEFYAAWTLDGSPVLTLHSPWGVARPFEPDTRTRSNDHAHGHLFLVSAGLV
jgi:hypothetical protein